MSRKPKRQDSRRHKFKNFNYLIKKTNKNNNRRKSNKMGHKITSHTVHDMNGKSTIRNLHKVTEPLIFSEINYLLSGNQSLTDVDGQLEINGNLFIIESKTHYNSINGGQLVSLFHTVYNTWKCGKIGQLVYIIDSGKTTEYGIKLYDYVVFGSTQFKQYEDGMEITPFIEIEKPKSWLAFRLRAFQTMCISNHDRTVQINNRHLFGAVDKIKKKLIDREGQLPF